MKLNLKQFNYRNLSSIIILFLSDTCAYVAALMLAFVSRVSVQYAFNIIELEFTLSYVFREFWWILVILLIFMEYMKLYSTRQPYWQEARKLFAVSLMTFILVFAIVSMSKMSHEISRMLLVLLWFYATIFLILFRYLIKRYLYGSLLFSENVIIIGDYDRAERVAESFEKEKYLGFNIIGAVPYEESENKHNGNIKSLGNIRQVQNIIRKNNISIAIVIPDMKHDLTFSYMLEKLQLNLNKVIVLSDNHGIAYSNTETMQTLNTDLSYMQINNNLKSILNNIIKRAMDILLSLILLPFVLLIVSVIAIAIKIDSEGPVFYRHKRVGRYGKPIRIFKFRSMYRDSDKRLKHILQNDINARMEWEKNYKLKNDPRVTRVGGFLRKSSLDELPQIFNVLKGDMSLIGPRPVLREELIKYYKEFSVYYFMVRPGITGLWQISGRSDSGYEVRVARDSWYVLNWSLWLDCVILLKTPAAVLKGKGAY